MITESPSGTVALSNSNSVYRTRPLNSTSRPPTSDLVHTLMTHMLFWFRALPPTVAFFCTSFLGGGLAIVPRTLYQTSSVLAPGACRRRLQESSAGLSGLLSVRLLQLSVSSIDSPLEHGAFRSRRGEAIVAVVTIDVEWRFPWWVISSSSWASSLSVYLYLLWR